MPTSLRRASRLCWNVVIISRKISTICFFGEFGEKQILMECFSSFCISFFPISWPIMWFLGVFIDDYWWFGIFTVIFCIDSNVGKFFILLTCFQFFHTWKNCVCNEDLLPKLWNIYGNFGKSFNWLEGILSDWNF